MSGRDANQLAADERTIRQATWRFEEPDPARREFTQAVDRLVALVGTLQQRVDEVLRVTAAAAEADTARIVAAEAALARQGDEPEDEVEVLRKRVERLQQQVSELVRAARSEQVRANDAEAALAEVRRKWQIDVAAWAVERGRLTRALATTRQALAAVAWKDSAGLCWCPGETEFAVAHPGAEHSPRCQQARRALAAAGGDTEHGHGRDCRCTPCKAEDWDEVDRRIKERG